MKTIFHDKESGTKLEMEGTFANSKAQLVDNEGNVTTELEGSYSEVLEMINELSGINEQEKEEPQEACEDVVEDKDSLVNTDFRSARVEVLEDITDEYDDTLDKGTITTDVNVLLGNNLLINRVLVEPKDFKKLEILTDGQKDIQPDELFVVNNDEMEYYLGFEKGEIVKFLYHREEGIPLPLVFINSEGIDQTLEYEDVTLLENQEGNKLRFNFCYENDILLTEDTSLKGTKVNLTEHSVWIEDDESLVIHTDCDDGIPYILSNKSGKGAFISLENLEKRAFNTPSFEIGEIVKVKQGRENGGAVGYAKITHFKSHDNVIELEGTDDDGIFSDGYVNAIKNLEKIK
ncbi:MAG: hypothetical protein L0L52_05080 [Staphylococcus equorum]|nr:hypothetical protein [Staphylococcus equorum]